MKILSPRKIEISRLEENRVNVDFLIERTQRYGKQIERNNPDAWLNVTSYDVKFHPEEGYIPLIPGDSLTYKFKGISSVYHPLLYVGKGFVVGFVMFYPFRGKMNLEFISDCFSNQKNKPPLTKLNYEGSASRVIRILKH